MNLDFSHTIPLKQPVKAAAIDMGEDFTKVESTYSHWGFRILKDISNKLLRLGSYRGIFPIHNSFKTVAIPLGTKRITFVGLIDECGYKIPLTEKTNIVGQVEEQVPCGKCKECGQDDDICDQLSTTETTVVVSITDSTGTNDYTNTVSTYFENGNLYVVNKQWILNLTTNLAEEEIFSEFKHTMDLLPCGCIEPTDGNLDLLQSNCPSCYNTCYTPCRSSDQDLGGYRVLDEVIQFDINIPYSKVYIEWQGALPKKNGLWHIPEIAEEVVVAGIKHRATWNRFNLPNQTKVLFKQDYESKLSSCQQQLGRMKLSTIVNSTRKIAKVNRETFSDSSSCGSMGSTFIGTPNTQGGNSPAIINIYQSGGSSNVPRGTVLVEGYVGGTINVTGTTAPVIGIADASNTINSDAFKNVNVEVWRGNLLLMSIDPMDGSNYFTKSLSSGSIIFNNPLGEQEPIRIKTIP